MKVIGVEYLHKKKFSWFGLCGQVKSKFGSWSNSLHSHPQQTFDISDQSESSHDKGVMELSLVGGERTGNSP